VRPVSHVKIFGSLDSSASTLLPFGEPTSSFRAEKGGRHCANKRDLSLLSIG
jgi:hypothetical protein